MTRNIGLLWLDSVSPILTPAEKLYLSLPPEGRADSEENFRAIFDEHPVSTFAKVAKAPIDGPRPEKIVLEQTLITKAAEEKKNSAAQRPSRRPGE